MTTHDDGGPLNPVPAGAQDYGASLLDLYAGLAMAARIARGSTLTDQEISDRSFRAANAMIAEKRRREKAGLEGTQ